MVYRFSSTKIFSTHMYIYIIYRCTHCIYVDAPRSDLSDVEANVPAVVQVNPVNQQPERSLDHVDLTVEQLVTLSDTEDVD